MHDVQACTRRGLPSIMMVVFWTFGFQVRADLWFEWLTLWPKLTPLPHSSQRDRTRTPPAALPTG